MTANYDKTTASVYHNDFLMRQIIGNVEQFKDRNSLELTSRRLRELCLTTPITRMKKYAIRSEDQYVSFSIMKITEKCWKLQFPSLFHLLGHPRRSWSRLTISACSDTPEEEKTEILVYTWKNLSGNGGNLWKFAKNWKKTLYTVNLHYSNPLAKQHAPEHSLCGFTGY